jgi:hypothetical protein
LFLRDAIWKHYVRGQEITKTPSPKYVQVARVVQLWCEASEANIAGRRLTSDEQMKINGLFKSEMKAAGLL